MLSLIICSRTKDLPLILKENIESTIGTEYELVVIDNSKNQYSIFSAYNEGVRRSKGDLLCFMHDDIMYDAVGWGNNVVRHFDDPNTGLIGVLVAIICQIRFAMCLIPNCFRGIFVKLLEKE